MDAPRRSALFHIWQQDHAAEIKAMAGKGAVIRTRNHVARVMYEGQSDDVKQRMAEIVEEEYVQARRLYDSQLVIGGGLIPTLSDEEQSE